jgi:hypothetical protein
VPEVCCEDVKWIKLAQNRFSSVEHAGSSDTEFVKNHGPMILRSLLVLGVMGQKLSSVGR